MKLWTSGAKTRTAVVQRARRMFGCIPALLEEMARNPVAANAYLSALEALERGALTNGERHVVMLAVSVANESLLCVEVHRAAARAAGVDELDLDLIATLQVPAESRLQALTEATWRLLDKHGQLDPDEIRSSERHGVERSQIYEIIAIIGVTTISNYVQRAAGLRSKDTQ